MENINMISDLSSIPISLLDECEKILSSDFLIISRDTEIQNTELDEDVYRSYKATIATYMNSIDDKRYCTNDVVSKLSNEIYEKIKDIDDSCVHKNGNETITGKKEFASDIQIDNSNKIKFDSFDELTIESILTLNDNAIIVKSQKQGKKASVKLNSLEAKSSIYLNADEINLNSVVQINGKEVATKEYVDSKTVQNIGDLKLYIERWAFTTETGVVYKNIVVAK